MHMANRQALFTGNPCSAPSFLRGLSPPINKERYLNTYMVPLHTDYRTYFFLGNGLFRLLKTSLLAACGVGDS